MVLMLIGINLWLEPQISEHWPIKMVGWLIIKFIWLSRPGIASAFTPSEGIVHEWITSADVVIIRVAIIHGMVILLLVFSNRMKLEFSIKDSISLNILDSYDQYHWKPVLLIENDGENESSVI